MNPLPPKSFVQLKHLPIEHLERGRYQPRQHFEPNALNELAQSIASQGLIEPLIVQKITDTRYEIIAGERRWRASMLAGLTTLPCLVGHYTNEQAAAVSLIENIQRQNLNLIEEAQSYQRLITEFQFTQHDVAVLIGKSRSHIANVLRLLTLSPVVQTLITTQQLSPGHARVLVGLPVSEQCAFAQQACQKEWSVRRLEHQIRQHKNTPSTLSETTTPDVAFLEKRLAEHVGAPVLIDQGQTQGGWLKIKYYDLDTLAGLLERIGLPCDLEL